MALSDARRCKAKSKSTGERCRQPAVVGYDVCRLHGAGNVNKGKRGGRPIVTGRYSVKHRAKLAEKYQKFLEDPRPGDLLSELAMMRALFEVYLGRFEDGVPLPVEDVGRLTGMLSEISKLVERVSKVEASLQLTIPELNFAIARVTAIVREYLTDEQQQELAERLRFELWGEPPEQRVLAQRGDTDL